MTVTTADKLAAVTLAEEQFRDTAPTAAAALEALRRDMEREQSEEERERRINAVESEIDVLWRGFAP